MMTESANLLEKVKNALESGDILLEIEARRITLDLKRSKPAQLD